jgi:hypothetical protein
MLPLAARCWLLPLAVFALVPRAAGAVAVDLELVLAIDVSGSVDPTEFALQRDGYVNAFNDPAVVAAIEAGPIGSIAATVVYWQGTIDLTPQGFGIVNAIEQPVPWTRIADAASASAFASAIASTDARVRVELGGGASVTTGDPNAPLQGDGFTGARRALLFSRDLLLAENGFEGSRLLIDISGDGFENVDHDPSACSEPQNCRQGHLNDFLIDDPALHFAAMAAARDLVVGSGITINALPILTDFPELDTFFYEPYVVGGPGAFSLSASDFDDLDRAVRQKLIAEVVPEPGSFGLLALGLGSAAVARRLGVSRR